MNAIKSTATANEHWIEASLDKLEADRALFSLAEMSMQDWCSQFGGPPTDPAERLALRCSLEPAASKLLSNLEAMPEADRRALAHRLFPASRSAAPPPPTAGRDWEHMVNASAKLVEAIERALGGSYEMPDGRKFWIDGPVAREMTRRVLDALPLSVQAKAGNQLAAPSPSGVNGEMLAAWEEVAEALAGATPQDIDSAERVTEETTRCPTCDGEGEVECRTFTNYDKAALGIQFFGIGQEHVNAERLFRALLKYARAKSTAIASAEAKLAPSGVKGEVNGEMLAALIEARAILTVQGIKREDAEASKAEGARLWLAFMKRIDTAIANAEAQSKDSK